MFEPGVALLHLLDFRELGKRVRCVNKGSMYTPYGMVLRKEVLFGVAMTLLPI